MSYTPIKDPYTSRIYKQEAIELAFMYAPVIYACKHCNHPVAQGYCCGTCGSDEPERANHEI